MRWVGLIFQRLRRNFKRRLCRLSWRRLGGRRRGRTGRALGLINVLSGVLLGGFYWWVVVVPKMGVSRIQRKHLIVQHKHYRSPNNPPPPFPLSILQFNIPQLPQRQPSHRNRFNRPYPFPTFLPSPPSTLPEKNPPRHQNINPINRQ